MPTFSKIRRGSYAIFHSDSGLNLAFLSIRKSLRLITLFVYIIGQQLFIMCVLFFCFSPTIIIAKNLSIALFCCCGFICYFSGIFVFKIYQWTHVWNSFMARLKTLNAGTDSPKFLLDSSDPGRTNVLSIYRPCLVWMPLRVILDNIGIRHFI
jgi:hypothetical protein